MSHEFKANISPRMIRSTPEELVEQPIKLRDFLTHVLTRREWKFKDMPKQIDLGEFDDMVNRIITLSETDPKHPEYGCSVLLDTRTNEFSFTNLTRGDENSVHQLIEHSPTQRFAADIHSHGQYDTPFSGTDLTNLFSSNAIPVPPPVTILVTPHMKMLIARTEDTIGSRLEKDIRPDFYSMKQHKRMFALTRFAQQYDFKVYTAPRSKRVLTLAS